MSKWYTAQGNNSDVVVSSKIRLARNLADAPFPSRMSNEVRNGLQKDFCIYKKFSACR